MGTDNREDDGNSDYDSDSSKADSQQCSAVQPTEVASKENEELPSANALRDADRVDRHAAGLLRKARHLNRTAVLSTVIKLAYHLLIPTRGHDFVDSLE